MQSERASLPSDDIRRPEPEIDPTLARDTSARTSVRPTGLLRTAATNRTKEIANSLITLKDDILNLTRTIEHAERGKAELQEEMRPMKERIDSQAVRISSLEATCARHGLHTDDIRILTKPQRDSMEEAVKGALHMAMENRDENLKLNWNFDQPYRSPHNQAQKGKLTQLLQNRLSTDIPLPRTPLELIYHLSSTMSTFMGA
jgi:hypothetical protein